MCGISAYVSNKSKKKELLLSLESISHRGPDFKDINTNKFQNQYIGLGHVRLSIVDLSDTGNQPMISRNRRYIMVYNGELYNTKFLKKRLGNIKYKGTSDSEILLEYFSLFGVDGFNDLRGMFSVIFYDTKNGEITALRDHLGIKPLYYSFIEGEFYLSSEIKGLKTFINKKFTLCRKSLFEFINLGFMFEPLTGIEEVKKVPPGSYLCFKKNKISIKNYFKINSSYKDFQIQNKSFVENIRQAQFSDAQLGIFYSGGVDSSIIAQLLKKDLFYVNTSGSDGLKSLDEVFSKKIAKIFKLPLIEVLGSQEGLSNSFIKNIKAVVRGNEELISDYTFLASKIISNEARKYNYKAMLSGMGADEAFCGYARYKVLQYSKIYKLLKNKYCMNLIKFFFKIFKFKNSNIHRVLSFLEEKEFCYSYARLVGYLTGEEIKKLWKHNSYNKYDRHFQDRADQIIGKEKQSPDLIKAFLLESEGFLTHNLVVADKSSMAESVELRVPFVNPDIFISNFRELKKNNCKKVINKITLKSYLENYLPKDVIYRKKEGFNPPLKDKIMSVGEKKLIKIFTSGSIHNYLCIKTITKIVNEHFSKKRDNTLKIWQLLYLTFWLQEYID